jgi:hypothetical protein
MTSKQELVHYRHSKLGSRRESGPGWRILDSLRGDVLRECSNPKLL